MPRVEITDAKGLVQKTGTGVAFSNAVELAGVTTVSGGITTGVKSSDALAGLVNDMHISGLNPTWNTNFGGILEGQTAEVSTENVLTSANMALRLSYALQGLALQTGVVTVAQAGVLLDGTGILGADFPVEAGAMPTADMKVVRLTGNYDDVALSIPDLTADTHQTLLIFTNNVVTAGGILSFQMHVNNEFDAQSTEIFVSNAGGTTMTRVGAFTDLHNQLILTDSGGSTMLAGSFIYFHSSAATDTMTVKACLRTSTGTIAVTEANND